MTTAAGRFRRFPGGRRRGYRARCEVCAAANDRRHLVRVVVPREVHATPNAAGDEDNEDDADDPDTPRVPFRACARFLQPRAS